MKKAGLTAAAMFFAAASFAQTPTTTIAQSDKTNIAPVENTRMKELDSCIRKYNSEKNMAKHAMIRGDFKTSKADYARADTDKKHYKAIAAELKSEGVSHPIRLALKEIKKADQRLIIADVKTIKSDKLAKQKALKAGDSTAVKAAENNLIADKINLKKDIRESSHDEKHFVLIRSKS